MVRRMISCELSEKRRRAGRLGGSATSAKYGTDKRREWGAMGGRPALKTLEEIETSGAPVIYVLKKERAATAVNSSKFPWALME